MLDSAVETMLLSEAVLAKDWAIPGEDEAWEYLEPSAALKASMDELESGGGQRFATWQDALDWLEDEAENALLIESGVLPKLIQAALQTKPSGDWRSELAKVCDDDIELNSPNWLGESFEELKQRGFERINDPRRKASE